MDSLIKRRGLHFAAVEHLVIDDTRVTAASLLLYVMLTRYADWETGKAFPSITTLQTRLKMRRQAIVKAISGLKALGYVSVERHPGKPNIYFVGPVVEVKQPVPEKADQFPLGTGVVPPGNGCSSTAEPELSLSNERHITILESPPPKALAPVAVPKPAPAEIPMSAEARQEAMKEILRRCPHPGPLLEAVQAIPWPRREKVTASTEKVTA